MNQGVRDGARPLNRVHSSGETPRPQDALSPEEGIGVWSLELDLDPGLGPGRVRPFAAALERWPGAGPEDDSEVHPEDRAHLEESLRRSLSDPQALDVEYRVIRDGRVTWLNARAAIRRDASGVPRGLDGAVIDITKQKEREEELLQTKRLESIGQLAAGVAHDFNNLLTVIGGYAEMVAGELDSADPLRPKVSQILRAAERAGSLTRQLLAFSRREPDDPRLLDLNDILLEMDLMLRRLIGADVRIVTVPGGCLWKVSADPTRLEQVVVNLSVNARDAMPEGGTLTLRTANRLVEVEGLPEKFVELTVTDTGRGMDQKVRDRIFEPFFTTKKTGDGTGLGLATVHSIVRNCRGRISVETGPGRGTTFTILLPAVAVGGTTAPARGFRPRVTGGRETILLVEDEDTVREFATDTLRAAGYHVLPAREGIQGLSLAEAYEGRIHLLLADVVMPVVGGDALAGMMVPNHPGLKVLYVTGYAEGALKDEGRLGVDVPIVDKPFSGEELLRRVREILDG